MKQITKSKVVESCLKATAAVVLTGGVGFQLMEIQNLEKQVGALQNKNQDMSKALSTANDSILALEHENDQLSSVIEKVTHEKEDVQNKLSIVQSQLKQTEQKLQQSQQQVQQLQKQLPRRSTVNQASAQYPSGKTMTAEISAYTTGEPGVNGITASGKKVQFGMIAMDRSVPFGTKVRIYCPEIPEIHAKVYTVEDRGGYIKGSRIDIYVTNSDLMYRIGRRNVQVEIL